MSIRYLISAGTSEEAFRIAKEKGVKNYKYIPRGYARKFHLCSIRVPSEEFLIGDFTDDEKKRVNI